jgi:TP901 family phage tail tape measure protein
MADTENQIVNRIVVTGLDESGQKIKTLQQQLKELKDAKDRAFQSEDSQSMFKGEAKGLDELGKLYEAKYRELQEFQSTLTQATDKRAQQEIAIANKKAQAEVNSAVKASEELDKIHKETLRKQAQADKQSTDDFLKLGKETIRKQQEQIDAQTKEQIRQVTGNPAQEKKELAKTDSVSHANKQSDLNAAFAIPPSYMQQMSSLNDAFRKTFTEYKSGAIQLDEYASKLAGYKKDVADINKSQKDFNSAIGNTSNSLEAFSQRVKSHLTWIVAGGLIASAVAIPVEVTQQLRETESLTAKIKQNLELAPKYEGNMSGLNDDVKHLQDVAATFAMGYGVNLKDTMEMMQVLSRRFKSPEELTYYTNLAMTMSKLDFVAPKKAAEDLEATILSMGLNFDQSKRFIDEFSVAVHVARITGTELLTGLQRSAATFHNMNFNTAEAIAMISTLTTVTAKAGANVGASLNSILINIDFKKAADALKAYSIQVYDSSGQMRDGVEIWRDIAKTFNGLNTQKANEFANAMSGGKFRANDLRALIGNWETFEKILTDINEKASPELTAKLLQTGMATLDTNITQCTASLQVFGMTIGNATLPQLKEMVNGLTQGVQWLNQNKESVSECVKGLGVFVEALVLYRAQQILASGALGRFIENLLLEAKTAPTFNAAMSGMGGAVMGFATTLGLAVLKMGAFYAAAQLLNKVIEGKSQGKKEDDFLASIQSKETLTVEEQEALDAINSRNEYANQNATYQGENSLTGKWTLWAGSSDSFWDKDGKNSVEKEDYWNNLNDQASKAVDKVVTNKSLDDVNKMVEEAAKKLQENPPASPSPYQTIEGQDLGGNKGKGAKNPPSDVSDKLEQKVDTYNTKSTLDQQKIATDNYKASVDNLTDSENRLGKTYESLTQRRQLMIDHMATTQQTIATLTAQMQEDLGKVNTLADETGATITVNGGGNSPEATAFSYLTNAGYNPEMAAGIIGNLMTESGLNPNAQAQDGSGSYGIGQWLGDRKQGLFDFANTNGSDASALETQLAYLVQEMKTTESGSMAKVTGSTPEEFAYAISKYYERPAWAENPDRQQNARSVYQQYLGGELQGSPQQVSIEGLGDTLGSAGISKEVWKGMSAESKTAFIEEHKKDVKDAGLLIGYLKAISDKQKDIAKLQKEIADGNKKVYEETVNGLVAVQEYQNKISELRKRSAIAVYGVGVTDVQKDQSILDDLVEQKKNSDEMLRQAKKFGIDIFKDPKINEERIKNLELGNSIDSQKNKGITDQYKETADDIEYRKKISEYNIGSDNTVDQNQSKRIVDIDSAREKVKALQDAIDRLRVRNNGAFDTKEIKDYNLQLLEAKKTYKELAEAQNKQIRESLEGITNSVLLQGESLKSVWKKLWSDLANEALKALFHVQDGTQSTLGKLLSSFSGSKATNSQSGNFAGLLGNTDWLGTNKKSTASSNTDWGGMIGSVSKLFHAKGGIVDTPAIAGEDGEEVIVPVQNHTGNSANLMQYAANKLGMKNYGVTPDFKNADIATKAANITVNSTAQMAKTNSILATQNTILTTMLNQMANNSGNNGTAVVVAGGGQQSPTMDDFTNMYSKAMAMRNIK